MTLLPIPEEVAVIGDSTPAYALYYVFEFQRACRQLGVPDECVYHFGLYLIQRRKKKDDFNGVENSATTTTEHFSVVRKLQDFESPYISQKVTFVVK